MYVNKIICGGYIMNTLNQVFLLNNINFIFTTTIMFMIIFIYSLERRSRYISFLIIYSIELILFLSLVFNFTFLIIIQKKELKKSFMAVPIVLNIFLLFYFKYLNFSIENINMIFGTAFKLQTIILPVFYISANSLYCCNKS